MALIFNLSNLVVLPFWLLMIFLPHWPWTRRIMAGAWPVVIPALIYAVLIGPRLPGLLAGLANPSLAEVAALLGTPEGALIGWAHFLAFDLFVGRWAYLDGRERNLSAWLASPALFFVLMAGPIGFLLHLALRWAWAQRRVTPA